MANYFEKGRSNSSAQQRGGNDILIAGRFRIEERLGGGAFGEVFKGVDTISGLPVAMKMELTKDTPRSHLNLEHKIYHRFNECPVTVGVPKSYFCGKVGDYTVMVMDLLGPCLEDLFNACRRSFSEKTVAMIGIQVIHRIQYLHSVGYLHRDIKPENFVMGINDTSHVVYVIDVGLSKAWRDFSGVHVPFMDGKSLTGTARYVSINTHEGFQQSRRDDLEAVTYLILYFLRGSLPWQGLKANKNDVRYERIRDVKKATSPEELANGYSPEFGELVRYARGLKFEEEPDYTYCVNLLHKVIRDKGGVYDYNFEWNSLNGSDIVKMKKQYEDDFPVTSQHQTAVANAGNSMMMSSAFLEGSRFQSQASSNHFLKEMEDAYGLGDFY